MHNQEAFGRNVAGAIVVAAGSGSRMGDGSVPKQYRAIGGRPMLIWSVAAMLRCEGLAWIVVVVPPGDEARAAALLPVDKRLLVTAGGDERSVSVANGLRALERAAGGEPPDKVLIHDAARPGLSAAVIGELLAALDGADAAAPALPILDAVKETGGDTLRTVPRDRLVRVQTPQAFRWSVIRGVHDTWDGPAVDDLAMVEGLGASVVLTPGRVELMKVTHAEDVAVVEKLIGSPSPALRIGQGYDVHALVPGDGVIVCGVKIPHDRKLEGHSDADVAWHALTDAILGAAALGDIGDHFPPSDPQWKGAASIVFLKHAVKLAGERGLRVVNADITILAEKPKISPHREAMRLATAEALGVALDAVAVKATTTERLGFVGREEGIAAQAVVLLGG